LIEIINSLSAGMPGGRFKKPPELTPLEHGGSDRIFYRARSSDRTAVAMVETGGAEDFESYCEIGNFLRRGGIAVPELFGLDARCGVLLMEDLGDTHLEDVLAGASRREEQSLYERCIDILIRLESSVTSAMEREGMLEHRRFDESVLLRETEYFNRAFIEGFCPVERPSEWDSERAYLADTLVAQPPVFMHRDFQSRNILIKDGELRIVDFQSAHRGPGLYDAASLLKDAYHPIAPAARTKLLRMLYEGLRGRGGRVPDGFEEYHEVFVLAGIQRNLQALAAFARLGSVKGKQRFLRSIPAGLKLLREGLEESDRLPALTLIIDAVEDKLKKGRGLHCGRSSLHPWE
jgi:aminoglycoside/choline kinase family phosphotransferase